MARAGHNRAGYDDKAWDWASDELNWDTVQKQMEQDILDGKSKEDALNKAINEQIATMEHPKTKMSYENLGIWSAAYANRTYSGLSKRQNAPTNADFVARNVKGIQRRVSLKPVVDYKRISNTELRVYERARDGTQVEIDLSYDKEMLDLAQSSGIIK